MGRPGGRLLAMRNDDLLPRRTARLLLRVLPAEDRRGLRRRCYRTVEELKLLGPDFVSVTWGAGGSTRRKTVEIVIQIQQEIGITAMAHLSCIGSTPDQLAETLRAARARGDRERARARRRSAAGITSRRRAPSRTRTSWRRFIRSRLELLPGRRLLSGDAPARAEPAGRSREPRAQGGHRRRVPDHAALLRQRRLLRVPGARARGGHLACRSFRASCRSSARPTSGASPRCARRAFPTELEARLRRVEHDDALTLEVGVEWATQQCQELLDRGAPGIHFYTMNKSPATRRVFENLRPDERARAPGAAAAPRGAALGLGHQPPEPDRSRSTRGDAARRRSRW